VSLLIDCPGIGKKTAEKLKGNWDETRGRRDAIVFLERYGVAPALAQRVAALHGTKTEARVRDDPFGSMPGLRGATFHRCDSLAARLGKKPDDPARLAAAMLQVLQSTAVSEGHVYVPWAQIEEGVGRVLGSKQFASLPSGALEEAADVLRTRGDVARFELTGPQSSRGTHG
jgi:exodeoxyribonuclease V alpha subunit